MFEKAFKDYDTLIKNIRPEPLWYKEMLKEIKFQELKDLQEENEEKEKDDDKNTSSDSEKSKGEASEKNEEKK
jgi:hypothetical protein